MNTDHNLLFGVLALQTDLIDSTQFAEACGAWAARKDASLAQILIGRGWITPLDREDVARLVERKLKRHGGDLRATLGAVADAAVRGVIEQVKDPDVQQSLASLPPVAGLVLVETPPKPSDERSRYTLMRLHSEGGLGKVWLARDRDLNREVALKELQTKQVHHPEARRRFLKEAQITGQLEHPNIVPVYELAYRPQDDQPFYTMKFVRGGTLRDVIAKYHESRREGTADPLEWPRLLGAFVSVCHALGYAHSRGVVHRDLKPSNVVMGSFGEVIVLDWGLAKVGAADSDASTVGISEEAQTDATASGRVLGTPAYMAPEQAEGRLDQVDHRTDIYGLGTILFAILTGRAPHPGDDTAEVLQRIISGDTPQARSVDPTVPATLNAICRKAMAKTRTDRYPGASDLGEDVQRWLADEPVSAHRDSWTVRATRWLRRNRAWAQAGAAGLLFCLFVSVAANIIVNRARMAEAGAREETARHLAEVRSHRRDLAKIRNKHANLLSDVGQSIEAERTYLQALTAVEKRAREFRNIPDYQLDLASLHNNLGILFRDTGRPVEAEAEYRKSLTVLREMHGDVASDPEFRSDYARSLNSLGQLLTDTQRTDEAEKSFSQAIEVQEKLVSDFPENPDYRLELAGSYTNLGVLLPPTERPDEAEAACRKAVKIQEGLTADYPGVVKYRQELATGYMNLGALFRRLKRPLEEEENYRKALTIQEELVQRFPTVPDHQHALGTTLHNLGGVLRNRGELAGARLLLERAVVHQQTALKANPNHPVVRPFLARHLDTLSEILIRLGDHAAAAKTAVQMAAVRPENADDAYNAACFVARCVPLARADETLPESERANLDARYADQAVELLRQSVSAGWKDFDHMQMDADLAAIRDHPAYKQLIVNHQK